MVINAGHSFYDAWVDIVHYDVDDIQEANRLRTEFIVNSKSDPQNVQVIQYKE